VGGGTFGHSFFLMELSVTLVEECSSDSARGCRGGLGMYVRMYRSNLSDRANGMLIGLSIEQVNNMCHGPRIGHTHTSSRMVFVACIPAM
jgi:hypothetical protein